MTHEEELTQAAVKPMKLTCSAEKCGHQLINEKNLTTHMKKFHEGLQSGVRVVRNIFTSPKPGPSGALPPSQTPFQTPHLPSPNKTPAENVAPSTVHSPGHDATPDVAIRPRQLFSPGT